MEAQVLVQRKEPNLKLRNKMKQIDEEKYFGEMLLALKVDDIQDAIRAKINPLFLNDYLIEYQKIRKKCLSSGMNIRRYDKYFSDLTIELKQIIIQNRK